jgi:hypothetical protein
MLAMHSKLARYVDVGSLAEDALGDMMHRPDADVGALTCLEQLAQGHGGAIDICSIIECVILEDELELVFSNSKKIQILSFKKIQKNTRV